MIKTSLFADQEREAKLNKLGDTLRVMEQHVNFAALAAEVDRAAVSSTYTPPVAAVWPRKRCVASHSSVPLRAARSRHGCATAARIAPAAGRTGVGRATRLAACQSAHHRCRKRHGQGNPYSAVTRVRIECSNYQFELVESNYIRIHSASPREYFCRWLI